MKDCSKPPFHVRTFKWQDMTLLWFTLHPLSHMTVSLM